MLCFLSNNYGSKFPSANKTMYQLQCLLSIPPSAMVDLTARGSIITMFRTIDAPSHAKWKGKGKCYASVHSAFQSLKPMIPPFLVHPLLSRDHDMLSHGHRLLHVPPHSAESGSHQNDTQAKDDDTYIPPKDIHDTLCDPCEYHTLFPVVVSHTPYDF